MDDFKVGDAVIGTVTKRGIIRLEDWKEGDEVQGVVVRIDDESAIRKVRL